MRIALFLVFVLAFVHCTRRETPPPPPAEKPTMVTGPTYSLSGKVSFSGTAAKPEVVKMNADPACAKVNQGQTVTSESLIVNPNKTLANVFVYVKEGAPAAPPASSDAVTFDQRGCRYLPHVLGLRVNQTLKILNSDPTLHNVNAQGKANSGFNAGMPTQGQVLEKKFTKPEVMVRVKCDVHGWMSAYIGVLDHPYFAVTDGNGGFSIPGLPAGNYVLEAWHEKLGTKTQPVVVTASPGPVEFQF